MEITDVVIMYGMCKAYTLKNAGLFSTVFRVYIAILAI